MQLTGTLDTFPLRELIEIIGYSSVAGVLEVRVGNDIGRLFFDDGRPYHAVVAEYTGFEAIGRMFEQRDAIFRFVAGSASEEETLWIDSWELVERAESQAQVWLSVHERIPDLEAVPSLRSSTTSEQIHINEHTWPVLSAVDGQRNVNAICETLGLAQLDVCVALVNLLDQGLISIKPRRSSLLDPQRQVASGQSEAARPRTGFFDRLLEQAHASEQTQRPDLTDENAQAQSNNRYISNRYVNNR